MSSEDLARFGDDVVADPQLQADLLATTDRREFAALVVERARARGRDVDLDDVEEGLRSRRRAWQERWI